MTRPTLRPRRKPHTFEASWKNDITNFEDFEEPLTSDLSAQVTASEGIEAGLEAKIETKVVPSDSLPSERVQEPSLETSRQAEVAPEKDLASQPAEELDHALDYETSSNLDLEETKDHNKKIIIPDIFLLFGNEKILVDFIFRELLKTGQLETEYISNREIFNLIKISSSRIRNLIYRLKNKSYLTVKSIGLGQASVRKFTISQCVFNQFSSQLLETASNKPALSKEVKTIVEHAETEKISDLPPEWQDIDISSLMSVNLRPIHIVQIYKAGKVSCETVQSSIYEMAHDIKLGNHKMLTPLLVLLSQLKKRGEPYHCVNPGFETDIQRYEKARVEEQKRSIQELENLKLEEKRLQQEAVEQLLEKEDPNLYERCRWLRAELAHCKRVLNSYPLDGDTRRRQEQSLAELERYHEQRKRALAEQHQTP